MKHTALVLLLVLGSSVVLAGGRWKIAVEHQGNDNNGTIFVAELMEKLNQSSFFYLVSVQKANIVLKIHTLDVGEGGQIPRGVITTYAVAFVVKSGDSISIFGDMWLGYSGTAHISSAADVVYARTLAGAQVLGEKWAVDSAE